MKKFLFFLIFFSLLLSFFFVLPTEIMAGCCHDNPDCPSQGCAKECPPGECPGRRGFCNVTKSCVADGVQYPGTCETLGICYCSPIFCTTNGQELKLRWRAFEDLNRNGVQDDPAVEKWIGKLRHNGVEPCDGGNIYNDPICGSAGCTISWTGANSSGSKDGFNDKCTGDSGDEVRIPFMQRTVPQGIYSTTFYAPPGWEDVTIDGVEVLGTTWVTFPVPPTAPTPTPTPPVTGLWGACAASGTEATVGWDPAPEANFYSLRVNDLANGWRCWDGVPAPACCDSPYSGDICLNHLEDTSYSFSASPGHSYDWWVHARYSGGEWSDSVYGERFSCPEPPPTPTTTPTPTTEPCQWTEPEVWDDIVVIGWEPYLTQYRDFTPPSGAEEVEVRSYWKWSGSLDPSAVDQFNEEHVVTAFSEEDLDNFLGRVSCSDLGNRDDWDDPANPPWLDCCPCDTKSSCDPPPVQSCLITSSWREVDDYLRVKVDFAGDDSSPGSHRGKIEVRWCAVGYVPPRPTPTPPEIALLFDLKFQGINEKRENKEVAITFKQGGTTAASFDPVSVFGFEGGLYSGLLTDFDPGTYDIFVKGSAHLQQKFANVNLVRGMNEQSWSDTPLLAGDVQPDNKVNTFDFAILASHFGANMPPGGSPADFDGDGDVDIFDFVLISENYYKVGEE